MFGEAIDLDDSVVDPLNAYADCGEGDLTSYDAATCVNATTGGYGVPTVHVYHYRGRRRGNRTVDRLGIHKRQLGECI